MKLIRILIGLAFVSTALYAGPTNTPSPVQVNVTVVATDGKLTNAPSTSFFSANFNLLTNALTQGGFSSGDSTNGVNAAFRAADVTTSNALTSAYIAADVTTSNTLVSSYISADVTTSNALVSGYIAADVTTSNVLISTINTSVNAASNLANTKITASGGTGTGNTFTTVTVNGLTATGTKVVMTNVDVELGVPYFGVNPGTFQIADFSVTSASAAGTTHTGEIRVDGSPAFKVSGVSDGADSATNKMVTIPAGTQFSPLGNTNYTSYAAGTAYSFTGSAASLDFGTTDPSVTLLQGGTYLIFANVGTKYNGATFAANQTVTVKLRRTNNTAADISNASRTITLNVVTTFTGHGPMAVVPPVIYTATAGDVVVLQGNVSATPSAGSFDADTAEIVAYRVY